MKIYGHTEDGYTKLHYAVHVKEGQSVSYSCSKMITGTNRYSKKSYARWELIERAGFRRTNKGTIVAFTRIGKTFRSPEQAFQILENNNELFTLHNRHIDNAEQLFAQNVVAQFGITSYKDVYPIAGLKELNNFRYIPNTLRTESRALDIMDFTRRTFGVRNYRKDLVRAVANANMPTIAVAKEFKNLVPADWLVKFISDSTTAAHTYANIVGLREILRHIDPLSYRRILRHPFTEQNMMLIENLTIQYRGHKNRIAKGGTGTIVIPEDSFGSFTELHDRLIGHRGHGLYREKPYENQQIALSKNAGRLHGTKFGDFVIAMATETDDMVVWGKSMKSCIGGYTSQAVGGSNLYGAVYKGDELLANFEVGNNGELTQLLGLMNEPLGDDDRSIIEKTFTDNGVKIPSHYWGSPQPVSAYAQPGPDPFDDPFENVLMPIPVEMMPLYHE